MSKKTKPELRNLAQLATEYNIDRKLLRKLIEEANLQPLHQMPYGRGEMKWYAVDEVEPLIKTWREARAAAIKVPEVTAETPAGDVVKALENVAALMKKIVQASTDESAERAQEMDEIREQNKALTEQNRLLFKQGEATQAMLARLLAELNVKAA